MQKTIISLTIGALTISGANAAELNGTSCIPLSSTNFKVVARASGALTSAASLTIGSNTGLNGELSDSNTVFTYTGTVNCDGEPISIVDGSTTYAINRDD